MPECIYYRQGEHALSKFSRRIQLRLHTTVNSIQQTQQRPSRRIIDVKSGVARFARDPAPTPLIRLSLNLAPFTTQLVYDFVRKKQREVGGIEPRADRAVHFSSTDFSAKIRQQRADSDIDVFPNENS